MAEISDPNRKLGAPQTAPEKVDTSFRRKVEDYFTARIAVAEDLAGDEKNTDISDEYAQMVERYRFYEGDLAELGYPNKKKTIQQNPRMVGEALGSLAGFMRRTNPSNEHNVVGEVAIDRENAALYESSKQVFMDSCAKTFPSVRIPPTHLLDKRMREMEESMLELRTSHLHQLHHNFSEMQNLGMLKQGNPRKLIEKLDYIIHAIGVGIDSTVDMGDLEKETQQELAIVSKTMYELQLLRDSIQGDVYGHEGTGPAEADAIIDTTREQILEEKTLTPAEVTKLFSDPSIKDLEGIKAVVTPEARASILAEILAGIDAKVEQGKGIAAKQPGSAVEARSMAVTLGFGVGGNRKFQFLASIGEGRIVDATKVGAMSIALFLKKYLDYDLQTDKKRRHDLETYTNMIG